MLNIIRYFLFVIVSLLLTTCVTLRNFPIETLQPANLTFEGSRDRIFICAPQTLFSEAIVSNVTASDVPTDSLIANILFSVLYLWKEAPGYENTHFLFHITPDGEQPKTSGYDMIVKLDELQITNTYYGQEYSFFEWEAYLYVIFNAKWIIYNSLGVQVDSYIDRDLMVWTSGIQQGKAEAVMNLPSVKDAWWDMGIAMANKYITRVVPQWKTSDREIYMVNKFPELSQQAYKAMQNNGYARAFDIWENMLLSCRNRHRKSKSQITYNMAVASEFENDLEQAIHWAQKSVDLNKKSMTVKYLQLLNDRKQKEKRLDKQMNND